MAFRTFNRNARLAGTRKGSSHFIETQGAVQVVPATGSRKPHTARNISAPAARQLQRWKDRHRHDPALPCSPPKRSSRVFIGDRHPGLQRPKIFAPLSGERRPVRLILHAGEYPRGGMSRHPFRAPSKPDVSPWLAAGVEKFHAGIPPAPRRTDPDDRQTAALLTNSARKPRSCRPARNGADRNPAG